MGYFDALMSSWFKTLPDGRKLFYPRGAWGRGYIVASERDYQRLRQKIKIYLIVMLLLMIGASVTPGYLWILGLGVLLLGFYYLVFSPYCVRGLQPSDEKLSLRDSYTNEALAFSTKRLWSMEIASIAFIGLGFVMLAIDPDSWLGAVAVIVIFVFSAAVFLWMLLLRRRASHS
jgi:hypothetical protein